MGPFFFVLSYLNRDKEKGVEEGVGIESYHVILPNVKEKYYNEDNKDELVGKLVIMVEERYEELEKLIEKYIELRPVGKKMVEISRDEELQGIYDAEEHARKVRNSIMATELKKNFFEGLNKGMKKGIKEGRKEGRSKETNNCEKNRVILEVLSHRSNPCGFMGGNECISHTRKSKNNNDCGNSCSKDRGF